MINFEAALFYNENPDWEGATFLPIMYVLIFSSSEFRMTDRKITWYHLPTWIHIKTFWRSKGLKTESWLYLRIVNVNCGILLSG